MVPRQGKVLDLRPWVPADVALSVQQTRPLALRRLASLLPAETWCATTLLAALRQGHWAGALVVGVSQCGDPSLSKGIEDAGSVVYLLIVHQPQPLAIGGYCQRARNYDRIG